MNPRMVALGLAAVGLPIAASAQTPPAATAQPPLAASAQAALEAAPPSWRFTPQVTATETWTDNVFLSDKASARSGWLTELIPSLRLDHSGPRLSTSAEYRYERDFYSGSQGDEARNFLDSFASYAIVDKSLWLEGRAGITQQRLSAFDAGVIPGAPGPNRNSVEMRRFSISPVWRGAIPDFVEYQARVTTTALRTQGFSDMAANELFGTLRSPRSFSRLGWAMDFYALRAQGDTQDSLYDRWLRASLIYAPVAQVHLSVMAGGEETDFAGQRVRESTPGFGVEWSPGPRTQFAGVVQRRFFGNGHLATFRHRASLAALEVSSRKEATVLSSIQGGGGLSMQSVMADLLTSSIPDPSARADAARRRLEAFGAAPTSLSTGFITDRPYVNREINVTVALVGVRNTLTLGLARRQRDALGTRVPGDSFAQSDSIRERGYTVALNHRLTPLTSMTFGSTRLKTDAVSSPGIASDQELDTLNLTTQLGPRTTVSLGVRRVEFESSTATPFRVRGAFGSITVRL